MSFPCSRSILAALFAQRFGFSVGLSDLHVPGFTKCTKLQSDADNSASRPNANRSGANRFQAASASVLA